jgi:hypothetical protein
LRHPRRKKRVQRLHLGGEVAGDAKRQAPP